MKISTLNTWGNKWTGVHTYCVYCPVWVKYSTRDVRVLLKLLWIFVFEQRGEGCNFHMTEIK
jgi:hypothetical protein